ncbi:MAG: cytochrome b/b6 domain-containing protein [Comamonadaceae bacterium]
MAAWCRPARCTRRRARRADSPWGYHLITKYENPDGTTRVDSLRIRGPVLPLTLLAGVQIAPRLGLSHDTGATIATLHTWLGDAILWAAGLHASAAIYHQLVLKDGVLASMLPSWALSSSGR